MARHRRSLLGYCLAMWFCCAILTPAACAEQTPRPWKDAKPAGPIGYINPSAKTIPVVPVKGTAYDDIVPDTPDPAEMAKLAINALIGATDPQQDYQQYFSVYTGNPLHMAHRADDWCTPKFTEAVALLRVVTGSEFMTQADQVWQDSLLKSIGSDGLYYFPIQGRPWYAKKLYWADAIVLTDGSLFTQAKLKQLNAQHPDHPQSLIEAAGMTQFTHPQPVGRIIKILAIYYLRDGNPLWLQMIDKMIDRFDQLAVKKGDYAYFGSLFYEPDAKFNPDDPAIPMPADINGGEISGRFIRACAIAYKLTGNKKSLDLGRQLINYMRYHDNYFGSDGEFIDDQKNGHYHYHDHTNYLLGILEYAHITGDKALLEFCKQSFQWAKSVEYGFGPVTGFAPERAYPGYPSSEGCAVGDMIALACNLSAFGVKDYYPDAERWFRNYFAEIQLTQPKADDLVRHFSSMPVEKIPDNETDDHVAQRNVGAFSGWASGNEWWVGYQDTDKLIMHCCTGNCGRAIFFLWNRIVEFKDGQLAVNMLLNRASPWADVYSYIPYQGRVEIKIKQACSAVRVHAPEWVPDGSADITAAVDGSPCQLTWDKHYINLGQAKPGQRIVITFPITEKTVTEKMGRETYTLLVRGNTVVGIDPPGRICPLFNRDYLRDETPRFRKVARFVADKVIDY